MRSSYLDKIYSTIFRVRVHKQAPKTMVTDRLRNFAMQPIPELLKNFNTSANGLPNRAIDSLIEQHGLNNIIREKRQPWPIRLLKTFYNPLIILLGVLAIVSFLTADLTTTIIISLMIVLSVGIRFYQENQAYNAAETLRSMVKTTCTVVRDGQQKEVGLAKVVPGDVIQLSAGDIVPADARIITSKDLFVDQSLLTGESMSVEKHQTLPATDKKQATLELHNLCLMGTNIESGTARAVIVTTGSSTYFGSLATSVVGERVSTSFDRGITKFTWLMIGFMGLMVPIVLVVNGLTKGNWWEAFLFAISVAVGLTPEMLPAIVTVNLSKGAIVMSKKKVVVKRLSSIQNFGAMDVLCTDKTGTLTQNQVILVKNIDINGETDEQILQYAYLNSIYQTGFKNLMDSAVLKHAHSRNIKSLERKYKKIDELPFDFKRRRLSVVVESRDKTHLLVCKGAVEEILKISTTYEVGGHRHHWTDATLKTIKALNETLSQEGFRVIAVAIRTIDATQDHYSVHDERELVFMGFMAFLDPPKESASKAIAQLAKHGVAVKVLTGDNELVTRKICKEVGLKVEGVLLGNDIERMDNVELAEQVEQTTIFAKLSPDDKRRVVKALQAKKHVVGFLGDGINDAPALRAADVGISVDTAVDIAKESADIILLELNLLVLKEGVLEGRRVFGNIVKYIRMGASSNFGNMFSMLGASILLPFLPMTPLQLLTNNLLYDFSQTTIPTDSVDDEYLEKPRKWNIGDIRRFMIYIGPLSSIFDYVTFGIMLYVFHAWQFPALLQTGWFVESLLTQTLIVHVIRSRKMPFLQTWASKPLLITTGAVMLIGVYLVFSPLAPRLGLVRLPWLFWPLLFVIILLYVTLTQLVKMWYTKKYGYN